MNGVVKTCLGAAAMTALLALCSISVKAQNTGNPQMDTGTQKMMKSADATFAMKAAQGGLAEVQLGQLAAQKANSPEVKAFGQHMVDDHTKANNQLMSVAQGENMTLPTTMNAKDQAEYEKLQGLSGNAFDREYVSFMVKDHEQDVKEFQKEASHGQDTQMKNFAKQTVPVLKEHLSRIRSIQGQNPTNPAEQH